MINSKDKEMHEPSLQEKAGKAFEDAKATVQKTFDSVTGKAEATGGVAKEKAQQVGDEIKDKESK